MLGILWMILIGFIVGLLARALKPGDDSMGLIATSFLGIAGAFVAGLVGQTFGWYANGEPAGFVASILGAIALLVIVSSLRGGHTHRV